MSRDELVTKMKQDLDRTCDFCKEDRVVCRCEQCDCIHRGMVVPNGLVLELQRHQARQRIRFAYGTEQKFAGIARVPVATLEQWLSGEAVRQDYHQNILIHLLSDVVKERESEYALQNRGRMLYNNVA